MQKKISGRGKEAAGIRTCFRSRERPKGQSQRPHTLTSTTASRTLPGLYDRSQNERSHGEDRFLVQTPRLHFPVVGNLWRHQWVLGLRSAWRGVEAQREGVLVAGHDADA